MTSPRIYHESKIFEHSTKPNKGVHKNVSIMFRVHVYNVQRIHYANIALFMRKKGVQFLKKASDCFTKSKSLFKAIRNYFEKMNIDTKIRNV
jgi:hypothetical protein